MTDKKGLEKEKKFILPFNLFPSLWPLFGQAFYQENYIYIFSPYYIKKKIIKENICLKNKNQNLQKIYILKKYINI